jgi:hypothetical protein|tara:strand:+ start:602 stop:748 length:147 start_codon:yes stop_codon:yes gene_type:complete
LRDGGPKSASCKASAFEPAPSDTGSRAQYKSKMAITKPTNMTMLTGAP